MYSPGDNSHVNQFGVEQHNVHDTTTTYVCYAMLRGHYKFQSPFLPDTCWSQYFGRGDDTVGNPHRAEIYRFELFELFLLLKLDNESYIERFEPTVSQSTVPSPPLSTCSMGGKASH